MTVTVILGGTFDPVHEGHLQSARNLASVIGDCRVVLVPCRVPPHRGVPGVSAADRFRMTELAVACDDRLSADDRELNREGISYTIDTLRSFRQELGSETPLIFVMGSDAWPTLPTWESWQYLTDYAHLLILERPGDQGRGPAVLTDWAAGMWTEDIEALKERPCGLICRVSLVQVDVSATEIRRRLKDGESVTGLLPDVVHRYIVSEQLYLAS